MSHVIHDSPTDHSPDAAADGDQLTGQQVISGLRARGYSFVTLDALTA